MDRTVGFAHEKYWNEFEVRENDLDFIYNLLLEREIPLTTNEMAVALIGDRLERLEEEANQVEESTTSVYLPADSYKVGERLLFPAVGNAIGEIVSVRKGENPDLGKFDVIAVEFEGDGPNGCIFGHGPRITDHRLQPKEKRQYYEGYHRGKCRYFDNRGIEMKDEILSKLRDKMAKTGEALEREFKRIRTGRASSALLDGIKVNCYETQMPLEQVASISVPESRLITIQPWDQSIIGEIEKAILKSELGLTPMNDGKIIRISIPPLTEERRKELAKLAKKMAEDSKISIRNHRREANDMFKELKNEKEISEDEMYKYQNDVQKITDDFIKKIDEITAKKEKEIMEF